MALLALVALIAAAAVYVATSRNSPSRHTSASVTSQSSATTTSDPPSTTTTTTAAPPPAWRIVWGSTMAWGYGEVQNATVRQLMTVHTGGSEIRFRVSNYFGNAPLQIGAATVAPSAGGSAVDTAQMHAVTFNGSATTVIPVGGLEYSDPIPMAVTGGETLDVSLWVSGADLVTLHPCCTAIRGYFTRNGGGNVTSAASMVGIGTPSPWERFVDAVDALQTTPRGSIVVIGDSITDGFHSSARWTDILQERVDSLPVNQRVSIINEAITANALTDPPGVRTDMLTGGGPPGVLRLQRDVLSQAGVSEVVMLLGTNDLWFGATAAEVIAGYQNAIAQVHADGLPIVAMTLLPRETDTDEYWSPTDQANLLAVDHWIRTSGAFNAVIDTARVAADVYNGQCNPTVMFPPFDSGDHLHPNAAGQTAIANFIQPAVLGLPPLPTVKPLVAASPTPGCAYAPTNQSTP